MVKRIIDKIDRIFNSIYYKSLANKMLHCGQRVIFERHVRIDEPQFLYLDDGVHLCFGTKIYFGQSQNNTSPPFLSIGKNAYIGRNCQISCTQRIIIEEKVMIADGCYIGDTEHIYDTNQPIIDSGLTSRGPIHIGQDSWIGANVCILPNVKIGRHCVIGAGSVVTKSIPDFHIAVGNPARILKKINIQ